MKIMFRQSRDDGERGRSSAPALGAHAIDVASMHDSLPNEVPRLYVARSWGEDDAVTLARGLRAAVDQTGLR
jgi:hypothetical protein